MRRGATPKTALNAVTLAALEPRADRSRPVAIWLFLVAAMVFAMVVLGGATRLTGSGLSITQWRPISGALPPMSDKAWAEDFRLYRAIPRYRQVNAGMTLAGFKTIYWWEWAHRLLGRLVGVAFAGPLIAFVVARRLPRRLIGPCVVLLALGGLQGLVGWWMVRSGLETRMLGHPRAPGDPSGRGPDPLCGPDLDRAGSLERTTGQAAPRRLEPRRRGSGLRGSLPVPARGSGGRQSGRVHRHRLAADGRAAGAG